MRLILAVLLLLPTLAFAQNNKQVEIEAGQELEWLRAENKYRATGDVTISQNGTVVKGNNAEAFYDPAIGPSALQRATVTGNVVITSMDKTIHADTAEYDLKNDALNLRGANITITAPDLTVTAHESADYFAKEGRATATGNAEVKQKGQTLRAQKITAWFDGNNKLQRATASGNVIIIRDKDIAQGNSAEYDLAKNTAILRGNVKITRGDNHMQGEVATIDLKTGDASLQNNGTGRVRAIFTVGGGNGPSITGTVPMINAKKEFEPAYAVGKRLP